MCPFVRVPRVNVHGTQRLTRKACRIIDGALIYCRDKDPRPALRPRCTPMLVGCYRLPVCGPRLGHRIHYQRPTKCRYARVDKAAPADYTITSCRGGPNPRATSSAVNTQAFTRLVRGRCSRERISESFGETPVGLRFRYFRSFRAHRSSYRTLSLFFFHIWRSPLLHLVFAVRSQADRTP